MCQCVNTLALIRATKVPWGELDEVVIETLKRVKRPVGGGVKATEKN